MSDIEPRRSRRRWLPAIDPVASPQHSPTACPSKSRQWARPQPPPAEQQGAQPRVRQLNLRKAALPPEARSKEAPGPRDTSLGQRRNSGKVQLKPQPPAAPYASRKTTGRLRSAGRQRSKDAVGRSDSPTKLDQTLSNKPKHNPVATKLASSHSITPAEAATAGMGSAAKPRTPFSGASPFKQAAHRPGPSSQLDRSTSRASLSRTNSTRSRLFSLEDRQHCHSGQQRRMQSAASARLSATQQQLKAVLTVLQQQQQQAEHAMQDGPTAASPGEGQLRSSCTGVSATELLKAAHHRAAAAAQHAIRDVLLTNRALHMQQQFEGLQQTASAASLAAQHVDIINNFLAIGNRVQQMINCTTRRQQQPCQRQEPRCGLDTTSQPAPVPQEQGQPESSSVHCRAPRAPAVLQELRASDNDQQHLWSGNITTNLLFVSTPSSCYGVSSPTYAGASPPAQTSAAQQPLQQDRSNSMDGWGDFQPLQHGLKVPKPASLQQQQHEAQDVQAQVRTQQEQQQQQCNPLHLLKNMQGEMLEWFVQYLERDFDKIQPHSRAKCVGMLRALSKAQDWAAQKLGDADSKCHATELTGLTADLGSHQNSVCDLRQDRSSRSMPEGVDGADLCRSGSSGGAVAPVVQLQQIQRALRKRVAIFGTLQHKLSSL